MEVTPGNYRVYIGTYTKRPDLPPAEQAAYQGRGEGIYTYTLDGGSGTLTPLHTTNGIINPSFLTLHPGRPLLYSVNQAARLGETPGGAVSAFAINPGDGQLTLLNQQPSQGEGPCHVSITPDGQTVLVANYRSGTAARYSLNADGSLQPPVDFVQHEGRSVNPQRQGEPHAHSITPAPDGRFAFVADLGLDKVMIYRLDQGDGLVPNEPPFAETPPGAGPRHFAFHPNGRFAYVINELDSTITVFDYASDTGRLTPKLTLSTLPDNFNGQNHTADIHIAPSGRFLYGSNRGHDSIAIFAIDPDDGRLTPIAHESTRGQTPRNFGLTPDGRYLLAANQNSDNVTVFTLNPDTGLLHFTGHEISVPSPVCVRFAAIATTEEI